MSAPWPLSYGVSLFWGTIQTFAALMTPLLPDGLDYRLREVFEPLDGSIKCPAIARSPLLQHNPIESAFEKEEIQGAHFVRRDD